MYADFEFYENSFGGDMIPEESFKKCAVRASNYMDQITFYRLQNSPPDEKYKSRISFACCAIAEMMYMIDNAEKNAQAASGVISGADGTVKGKMVSSISSGSETISYSTSTASTGTLGAVISADYSQRKAIMYDTAAGYLANIPDANGINILYAGAGYVG